MDNHTEQQTEIPSQASYGGSFYRMEYEEMEQRHRRKANLLENIIVSIGFGAVVIMVTMVLVAVSASGL